MDARELGGSIGGGDNLHSACTRNAHSSPSRTTVAIPRTRDAGRLRALALCALHGHVMILGDGFGIEDAFLSKRMNGTAT